MPDYSAFLKTMKGSAVEAVNATNPVNICYGKVTSVAPLKMLVDQKLNLGAAQLVLSRNVTDYETEVTVNWTTTDGARMTGKQKIKIHNALKMNDQCILARMQGGQQYIVLDKVG